MQSGFKLLTSAALACAALAATLITPTARAAGNERPPIANGPSPGGGSNAAESYRRGLQELQAHDYSAAIRDLRDAVRAVPNDANANYVLGLAYVGNNDNAHARGSLERAVRTHDAPLGAYLQLGLVYIALNNHDGAVAQQTTLQNMLTACDATCGDAQRAQIQSMLDALTQALNAPAPATAPTTGWNFPTVPEGRAAYGEAVGLINQQHYSQALVSLERAQAAIGPHPDILNYMGFTSRRLGRTDAALAFYREALALDPNHRGANEYLGELYLQMGRVQDARHQLARLDQLCAYGCAEREELQHWIELAGNDVTATR